jgi:hypothetical protein
MGYPEEFEEVPFGAFLYAHGRTMVANGTAARMVLYDYDFVDGQPQLKPRGYDQLAKIAHLLAIGPAPLVIERTPCMPGLADARRQVVLDELAHHLPHPVPAERVVVGSPLAIGLAGLEAEIVYRNILYQTRIMGSRTILGTSSGFGAGSTGQGIGGGPGGAGGAGGAGAAGGGAAGGGGISISSPIGP